MTYIHVNFITLFSSTLYVESKFNNNNKLMFNQSFIFTNTQLKFFMNSIGLGFEMSILVSSLIIFGRSFI